VELNARAQIYHTMELILRTFILKVNFYLFIQWTANLREIWLVSPRVRFNFNGDFASNLVVELFKKYFFSIMLYKFRGKWNDFNAIDLKLMVRLVRTFIVNCTSLYNILLLICATYLSRLSKMDISQTIVTLPENISY
jgi:hypothetical protein